MVRNVGLADPVKGIFPNRTQEVSVDGGERTAGERPLGGGIVRQDRVGVLKEGNQDQPTGSSMAERQPLMRETHWLTQRYGMMYMTATSAKLLLYPQNPSPARVMSTPTSDVRICHRWLGLKMMDDGEKSGSLRWFPFRLVGERLTVCWKGVVELTAGIHEEIQRPSKELVQHHPKERSQRRVADCLSQFALALFGDAVQSAGRLIRISGTHLKPRTSPSSLISGYLSSLRVLGTKTWSRFRWPVAAWCWACCP